MGTHHDILPTIARGLDRMHIQQLWTSTEPPLLPALETPPDGDREKRLHPVRRVLPIPRASARGLPQPGPAAAEHDIPPHREHDEQPADEEPNREEGEDERGAPRREELRAVAAAVA